MAGYSNHIGKNQSGKVAGADPEVDERLKNIEPKMIELITNEVRSQEELWSVIHILESPDRSALHIQKVVFSARVCCFPRFYFKYALQC